MADELSSIPRQLREQNVMIPDHGPVSIYDLATVGIAAVQLRADAAAKASEPVEPALAPPISADTDEPDELDKVVATAEELNDRLAAAEAAQQHDDLAATLERIERRTAELDERTASIEEAIASGDVQRLAELMGDELGEA